MSVITDSLKSAEKLWVPLAVSSAVIASGSGDRDPQPSSKSQRGPTRLSRPPAQLSGRVRLAISSITCTP